MCLWVLAIDVYSLNWANHWAFAIAGNAPIVIAEGGFSGVFPDSSKNAYVFALSSTSGDTVLWCNVQLTKDGVGICLRDLLMDNCTSISQAYRAGKKAYLVNGEEKKGWFPIDYTMSSLQSVICKCQPIIFSTLLQGSPFRTEISGLPLGPGSMCLWCSSFFKKKFPLITKTHDGFAS